MLPRTLYLFSGGLLLALAAGLALAADAKEPGSNTRELSFKAQSELVLVPVSVTDSKGGIMAGLPRSLFEVLENKVEQRIYSFSEEDIPAAIGFVLDLSGSMKNSLEDEKMTFRSLVDNSNGEDEGFLYTVSDRPELRSGFTSDLLSLGNQMLFSTARGSTALIDTVYASLDQIRSSKRARKGLVVISDGMDNHSRHTRSELMMQALEAGAQVYCISLDSTPGYLKSAQLREQRAGLSLLDDLSERTGGLAFVVRDQRGMVKAAETIGRALRSEYVIGYVPSSVTPAGRPGRTWRSIKVKVNEPGLKVHARAGYYPQ